MKLVLRRRVLLAPLLIAGMAFPACAQASTPQSDTMHIANAASSLPTSFEVASIRLVNAQTPDQFSMSSYPTARFFMHSTTLRTLVVQAYGIDERYIETDPKWMDSQEYDIDAKVEGEQPLTHEEIEPLLQNLLRRRFHLVVHHESKPSSGFALIIAKGGPKLGTAEEGPHPRTQLLPTRLDSWHITAKDLAMLLSYPAGHPVVDKTGLTGSYDIKLSFAPANDPNSGLPSIFTAIQEQLGLKLEPAKVPVDYLVIDRVDRIPTEN